MSYKKQTGNLSNEWFDADIFASLKEFYESNKIKLNKIQIMKNVVHLRHPVSNKENDDCLWQFKDLTKLDAKFMIVPVQTGAHFVLYVLEFNKNKPHKYMLIDSQGSSTHDNFFEQKLKNALNKLTEKKIISHAKINFSSASPNSQQDNNYDCGPYVWHNAKIVIDLLNEGNSLSDIQKEKDKHFITVKSSSKLRWEVINDIATTDRAKKDKKHHYKKYFKYFSSEDKQVLRKKLNLNNIKKPEEPNLTDEQTKKIEDYFENKFLTKKTQKKQKPNSKTTLQNNETLKQQITSNMNLINPENDENDDEQENSSNDEENEEEKNEEIEINSNSYINSSSDEDNSEDEVEDEEEGENEEEGEDDDEKNMPVYQQQLDDILKKTYDFFDTCIKNNIINRGIVKYMLKQIKQEPKWQTYYLKLFNLYATLQKHPKNEKHKIEILKTLKMLHKIYHDATRPGDQKRQYFNNKIKKYINILDKTNTTNQEYIKYQQDQNNIKITSLNQDFTQISNIGLSKEQKEYLLKNNSQAVHLQWLKIKSEINLFVYKHLKQLLKKKILNKGALVFILQKAITSTNWKEFYPHLAALSTKLNILNNDHDKKNVIIIFKLLHDLSHIDNPRKLKNKTTSTIQKYLFHDINISVKAKKELHETVKKYIQKIITDVKVKETKEKLKQQSANYKKETTTSKHDETWLDLADPEQYIGLTNPQKSWLKQHIQIHDFLYAGNNAKLKPIKNAITTGLLNRGIVNHILTQIITKGMNYEKFYGEHLNKLYSHLLNKKMGDAKARKVIIAFKHIFDICHNEKCQSKNVIQTAWQRHFPNLKFTNDKTKKTEFKKQIETFIKNVIAKKAKSQQDDYANICKKITPNPRWQNDPEESKYFTKEQKNKLDEQKSCKYKVKQNIQKLITDFINQIRIQHISEAPHIRSMLKKIIHGSNSTHYVSKKPTNNIFTIYMNIRGFMRKRKPDHLTRKEFNAACINAIQEYINQHLSSDKQRKLLFKNQRKQQEDVRRRRITDSYKTTLRQEVARKARRELTGEGHFTPEQYTQNLNDLIKTGDILSYSSKPIENSANNIIGYKHKIVLPYFDSTNNPIVIKSSAKIKDEYGTVHIKATIPNLDNDPKRASLLLLSYLRTLQNTGLTKVNISNLDHKLQARVFACCKLLKLETDIELKDTQYYPIFLHELGHNSMQKKQTSNLKQKLPQLPEPQKLNMPKSTPAYSQ
ncbi:MAG: hypothetical protein PVI75_02920 [Gammaproteobacteria bacterium]|jgi:hypothetical protein